jgi:hypothetical protein
VAEKHREIFVVMDKLPREQLPTGLITAYEYKALQLSSVF